MIVNELASAIYNDIKSGLSGITNTESLSMEQLEQDVVDERLSIMREYSLKNLVPLKDLYLSINCIKVDCECLERCCDKELNMYNAKSINHFEIPQIVNYFGEDAIGYLGSIDKQNAFKIYTSNNFKFHKYKTLRNKRPYVYIDITPNKNNMYDGFIFNAPLLERISITAIFKDLRQVEGYSCCTEDFKNMTFIDTDIKDRVTKKKILYYRQYYKPPTPNAQIPE